ncbi:hypothetical protein BDN70DRAFT_884174 [Pholiota conissans]|uniref:Uncharacterized protein n=1 Tax=Pholiota conissans TaxID=109636 RepID=A0A9P5YTW4_9AGAR|nr:hypothetical protein BDN70DRAFT_884174 [Pholiota conissans]
MPKSPNTKKRARKDSTNGSIRDTVSANVTLSNGVRQNLDHQSNKSTGHSAQFQAQKYALYAHARGATQEIVRSTTNVFDIVQAMLLEMQAQEIPFQKYHDDFRVVMNSSQESLDKLSKLYLLAWKTLGQQRAAKLEAASTMLVNNAPRRHEIMTEMSKKARQQLEQAKQEEKDAEDADKLIEHLKSLLRG